MIELKKYISGGMIMKFKKVLLTALCCAMATAAFAACEKDEESSKNPSMQQNPSIQTPNTQTPTTPVTPVVKTVTAEQWSQVFTAMPTVNNVTGTFVEEQYEGGTLKHKATSFLQVAGTKGYEMVSNINIEKMPMGNGLLLALPIPNPIFTI